MPGRYRRRNFLRLTMSRRSLLRQARERKGPVHREGSVSAPIATAEELSSVKISGRRQDADVARVADFLRGAIGVVAAVVVERLDQRGAGRHGMLAARRIVG